MKQLTSYNRAAGYLNKLFDMLNEHYFECELSRPTITIQSTPKAYGHFTLREDTWVSAAGCSHEINLGAGTLARPIEEVCATLLHEMVHFYCYVHHIKDTSRNGTYHNWRFKIIAETHGLLTEHHPKYGWTITAPADNLLDFILETGLTDILITRNEHSVQNLTKKSSSRKYICPCCGNSVRATKDVHISCMDCKRIMRVISSIVNLHSF